MKVYGFLVSTFGADSNIGKTVGEKLPQVVEYAKELSGKSEDLRISAVCTPSSELNEFFFAYTGDEYDLEIRRGFEDAITDCMPSFNIRNISFGKTEELCPEQFKCFSEVFYSHMEGFDAYKTDPDRYRLFRVEMMMPNSIANRFLDERAYMKQLTPEEKEYGNKLLGRPIDTIRGGYPLHGMEEPNEADIWPNEPAWPEADVWLNEPVPVYGADDSGMEM